MRWMFWMFSGSVVKQRLAAKGMALRYEQRYFWKHRRDKFFLCLHSQNARYMESIPMLRRFISKDFKFSVQYICITSL